MSRKTLRRLLTTTVIVPVSFTAYIAAAPGALASGPELAAFTGGFHTGCDLPTEGGHPAPGDYTCSHRATSLSCAWVVAAGPLVVENRTCSADLIEGATAGHADYTGVGYACVNGGGTGLVRFTPENGGPARDIWVWLDVEGGQIVITGSYIRVDDGQLIVYRGTMPALCTPSVDSPTGYQGTVTPL